MKCKRAIILFMVFFLCPAVYAIGDLGLGLNLGITYDPNNLSGHLKARNSEWEEQKDFYDTDGDIATRYRLEQINLPYSPVFGINLRYYFNYILFKTGFNYTQTLIMPSNGWAELETADGTVRSTVSYDTYQASMPVTFGFIVPVKKRTMFYIGAGLSMYMVNITQSVKVTSMKKTEYIWETYFGGYHLLVGAEIPIGDKWSFTAEWSHQSGVSHLSYPEYTDENGKAKTDKTMGMLINVDSNIFTFGLNYYLEF